MSEKLTPAQRFWAKVEKTESCWLWLGGTFVSSGHGKAWFAGKHLPAHRVAWELVNDPIPPGLALYRDCGNPVCVNPDHMHLSDPLSRFWGKIKKLESGCWTWVAAKTNFGHGRFNLDGSLILPHRLAYELTYGPISPGLIILHKCDNPACCNPQHLTTGTYADNANDMYAKGRGWCNKSA